MEDMMPEDGMIQIDPEDKDDLVKVPASMVIALHLILIDEMTGDFATVNAVVPNIGFNGDLIRMVQERIMPKLSGAKPGVRLATEAEALDFQRHVGQQMQREAAMHMAQQIFASSAADTLEASEPVTGDVKGFDLGGWTPKKSDPSKAN